jgi:hypothetical protein
VAQNLVGGGGGVIYTNIKEKRFWNSVLVFIPLRKNFWNGVLARSITKIPLTKDILSFLAMLILRPMFLLPFMRISMLLFTVLNTGFCY